MERRLVLFVVLSTLVLLANMLISSALFPRKVPVAKKDDGAKIEKPADEKPANDNPADDKPADENPANVEAKPVEQEPAEETPDKPVAPADEETPQPGGEKPAEPAADAPPIRRIALGSYDSDSGYRLLVTLTSAGAAVERVELNSPKYRELEDRSGYIGHLAVSNAPAAGGCIVQVVGHGTPAALAGIEPGDVIERLGDGRVVDAADFEAALRKTHPGDVVELVGRRGDQALKLTCQLGRRPLEMIRPEFERKPVDAAAREHDPLSLLLTLEQVGKRRIEKDRDELAGLDLRSGNWDLAESTIEQAVFRRRLDKLSLEITKRYRLAKAGPDDGPNAPLYSLYLDIEIHNLAQREQTISYRLDGPTGLPLEGAWYANKISRTWGTAGMRDVLVRFNGRENKVVQESCTNIADAKEGKMVHWNETGGLLDFIAVDTQYFSAALLPRRPEDGSTWFDDIRPIRVGAVASEKSDWKLTDVSFRMTTTPFDLPPGATLRHNYELFAGPKKPALLTNYSNGDANLGELVYYGWFGWVAEPMLWILHTFYALVRNYGIAIVMLTVLVRGAMFPVSRKQALGAQKMQELRPELQKITEKYKKPEERMRAQQELFRKHNYKPLGGCVMVFLQLPIFVGLYRSLMVDVELRQAPLISESIRWASNLAAPDMLWDWSQLMPGFVLSYLGPFLNLFPLATIGLMIWQQKMFMPPPTDEQTAMQQKMMSYMMIFMGVMFFKVACGLCLYFIASSVWGITERKLLPKTAPPPPPSPPGGGKKRQITRT